MFLSFKKNRAVKGFNLMEVCIAIAIISIITSSMWSISAQGYRYLNKYKQMTRARLLAQEAMEDALNRGYCGKLQGTGGRWLNTDTRTSYTSDDILWTAGDDYEGFTIVTDFYNCGDTTTAAIDPPDPADPPECPSSPSPLVNQRFAFVRIKVTWDSGNKQYVLESLVSRMNDSDCCPAGGKAARYYIDLNNDGDFDDAGEEVIAPCLAGCVCT